MTRPTAHQDPAGFVVFDREVLCELAEQQRDVFADANPYPNIVIDDFLPIWFGDMLLADFPPPDAACWLKDVDGPQAGKLGTRHARNLAGTPARLQTNLLLFNSSAFTEFIEVLTGISGLIPDPHLVGGGLHQIPRGGRLALHADFNYYQGLALDRRVNALLFLNKDWDPAWGGQLELWDETMSRCERRIDPLFNRLVVFATTSTSFHGHPDPVLCPEDTTRKSIAFYYYSNGRPDVERREPHETLWQNSEKTTVSVALKRAARRWVPPALFDLVKRGDGSGPTGSGSEKL